MRTTDVHAAVSATLYARGDEVQTDEGHAACRGRIPPDGSDGSNGSADDDGPVSIRHRLVRQYALWRSIRSLETEPTWLEFSELRRNYLL